MSTSDRQTNSIDQILSLIRKQYGSDALLRADSDFRLTAPVVSSGSLLLDEIMGVHGYPLGRIIEIYGPENSGKTTLALHAILEMQKQKQNAVFIDVEHALDTKYAQSIGLDLKKLLISQPNSGEEAMDILESLIKTKQVNCIVIDSVAALVPTAELEGKSKDITIGAQARLMSKTLRKIRAIAYQNNCLLIFINQVRHKVGVFFGNPETTPGGKALRFYSSLRLEVRKAESLGTKNNYYGNKVRIKVVKNKVATPFKTCYIYIIFGQGIDRFLEIIFTALSQQIITCKGAWYYHGDQKMGQGVIKTKEYLLSNPEVFKSIYQQVIDKIKV